MKRINQFLNKTGKLWILFPMAHCTGNAFSQDFYGFRASFPRLTYWKSSNAHCCTLNEKMGFLILSKYNPPEN